MVSASKKIDQLNAIFPHKIAATKAALGWIDKCALLITSEYGPRVRLVTVLTDAPLATNYPIIKSSCGNCSICVEKCPAKASKGINWKAGFEREQIFDANACDIELEKNKSIIGERICGICVSVCPKGKK